MKTMKAKKKQLRRLKICVACSAGGHLMEALEFLPAFEGHKIFFVTFEREQVKDVLRGKKVYYVIDPKRNPQKLLKNFYQTQKILRKEKPDMILSTGASAAVPLCYAAKIIGAKLIFVETLAAVSKPSLSGRSVYPLADLFVVQWKNLLRYYKRAVYGGPLI